MLPLPRLQLVAQFVGAVFEFWKGKPQKVVMILPASPSALAYFPFWFPARLPAWKKPGSAEETRSPRMKAIRKEVAG